MWGVRPVLDFDDKAGPLENPVKVLGSVSAVDAVAEIVIGLLIWWHPKCFAKSTLEFCGLGIMLRGERVAGECREFLGSSDLDHGDFLGAGKSGTIGSPL